MSLSQDLFEEDGSNSIYLDSFLQECEKLGLYLRWIDTIPEFREKEIKRKSGFFPTLAGDGHNFVPKARKRMKKLIEKKRLKNAI